MTKHRSAKRRAYLPAIGMAALGMLIAGSAAAADGATQEFRLQARVSLFCRINAPFEGLPLPANAFQEDVITLGAVTETCNSTSGYRVEARFMNLASGTLMLDEQPRAVNQGQVTYSHPSASRQVRMWRLANVVTTAADQPIFVRLSISPL